MVAATLRAASKPLVAGRRTLVVADGLASAHSLLTSIEGHELPYRARGRWLFVGHPWVRQFLLALRGLADEADALGNFCFLSRPFFNLGVVERVRRVVSGEDRENDGGVWGQARGVTRHLRARAHAANAGAAALALAHQTGLLEADCFHGANREVERALLWSLLGTIMHLGWANSNDLTSFVPIVSGWLEKPETLAGQLPGSDPDGVVELSAIGDVTANDVVDCFALCIREEGPRRLSWEVDSSGWVQLRGEERPEPITVRVSRVCIVPDWGAGGGR